ncbi:MAG: hypothetical protein AAB436_03545 [Patescibacteria group bacterium]
MYRQPSWSPVEMRSERYAQLFDGELEYLEVPLVDETELSLSALARTTNRAGGRRPELREHLATLPAAIDEILDEHDTAAHTDSDSTNALFAFVSPEDREIVSGIVADVFTQWEISQSRHGFAPLNPEHNTDSRWLVIETAAAVMKTAVGMSNFNIRDNMSDRESIAKILTSWGPKFTEKWFDGSILDKWTTDMGMDEEESERWRMTFNPSTLKKLADTNTTDPLTALGKVKEHLDVTLTDENIAEKLGWTSERVAEAFPAGTRMYFAVYSRKDPLKALGEVKEHLEATLTDESIAEYLGWEQDKVRHIFTPSTRRHFAVSHRQDPLKACEAWVNGKIKISATNDLVRDRKLSGVGLTKLADYQLAA